MKIHSLFAGSAWETLVSLVFFLIIVMFSTRLFAWQPSSVCDARPSAITYHKRQVYSELKKGFVPVTITGVPSVNSASRPRAMKVSGVASTIQFFNDRANKSPGLILCLHYTKSSGGKGVLERGFGASADILPAPKHVFTVDLKVGLNDILFIILRTRTANSLSAVNTTGYFYEMSILGIDVQRDKWREFGKLESKFGVFGGGFDGIRDGKKVVYPYKDKTSVLRRLRALGY